MSQEKRPPRHIYRPTPGGRLKEEFRLSEEERLRAALEKAEEYRNPRPSIEEDDAVTKMDEWADIVSTRIEEAMRRGDFDNLRGHGKPMRVEKDPFVPDEKQMAYQILKENNMAPTWIGERKEMLKAIENWRENFQRISNEAVQAWQAATDDERRVQLRERWTSWIVRWDDELTDLNRRIGTFNLKQPIAHLEIFKLRLDDELRRVGMSRTLGD
jgi:isopenicillin N synthase-like dioxygenase